MNKAFKVCLVGFGRISRRHVESLLELSGVAEIVAVVEIKDDRRSQARDLLGVPVYASIQQFKDSDVECDLIAVLVDSGSHFAVSQELLDLQVPVLMEKPLCLGREHAVRMVDSYAAAGVPLFVVKQNRLNPPVKALTDSLVAGELGRLLFVTASVMWSRTPDYYLEDEWRMHRETDGGVIWNQASHYVDLVVQVMGEIESVFAHGTNFLSPAETEDTVFALFRSMSGAQGSLNATTAVRPVNFEGTITVAGERGLAKVGGHALNELVAWTSEGKIISTVPDSGTVAEVYGQSHALVYSEIFRDLAGGSESQFRAEKGLHVVEVMEAIHKSINERREVRISEIRD